MIADVRSWAVDVGACLQHREVEISISISLLSILFLKLMLKLVLDFMKNLILSCSKFVLHRGLARCFRCKKLRNT